MKVENIEKAAQVVLHANAALKDIDDLNSIESHVKDEAEIFLTNNPNCGVTFCCNRILLKEAILAGVEYVRQTRKNRILELRLPSND